HEHISRYADGAPDEAERRRALWHTALRCLDARSPELLRQVDLVLWHGDPEQRAALERAMTQPAPVGPRAAMRLTGRPRAPLPALIAALDDPLLTVRTAAAGALVARGDPAGNAAIGAMLRVDDLVARRETINALGLFGDRRWRPEAAAAALELLTAALPGPETTDWFEDLQLRERIVDSAARQVEAGIADDDRSPYVEVLVATLALPICATPWVRGRVDGLRARAIAGLRALGDRIPTDVPALVTRIAERDELVPQLCETVFTAQVALAPPAAAERARWSERYRAAERAMSRPTRSGSIGYDQARAIAAIYDASGRLGDPANVPWLRQRLASGEVARAAAAGALLRLAGDDPAIARAVRSCLAGDAGKWPHVEVRAAAIADLGADADWALALVLDGLPPLSSEETRAMFEQLAAAASGHDQTGTLQRALLARLRAAPNDSHADDLARTIVRLDPAAALAARTPGDVGQRLVGKLLYEAPELLVPELDDTDRSHRYWLADALRHKSPTPALLGAFRELLARETLQDADKVLHTLAQIGPTAAELPAIERWLGRSQWAVTAMVAVGEPAVPRIAEVGLAHIRGDLRELKHLGPAGAPLMEPLLAAENELTREYAPHVFAWFGRPGLERLRTLDWDETAIANAAAEVVMDSLAHPAARLAAVDELLQHPEAPGVGHYDLAQSAPPELAERLLLLQGNRDPNGEGATTALLETLGSTDAGLRAFALRRLADHADRQRIECYVHWLRRDPDPAVQRAVAAFDRR
ncbi:MAG: hypothetical protein KDE27_28500, partial [Planctomycetes bacterium]|nr:hypothetical protein [Planctomycetota bacterium]